jgi:single-strand DNA-binding protein
MNVVCLTGRLGQTADLRYTTNGTAVTNFSLAVDRFGKGPNGEKLTLWVTINVWGKQAEAITPYLTKGKAVAVTGELLPVREYTTSQGQKRSQLQVNARQVTLLGGGEKQDSKVQTEAESEEIPF